MKKTIFSILLFAFAIVAWIIISMSGPIQRDLSGISNYSIQYLVALFFALAYVQWYIHRFLSPLQGMRKEDRTRLKEQASQKYKKGFFAGTIGFGYLLALIYGANFLQADIPKDTNFALGAIFFILVGTIARARDLTATLVDQLLKNQKKIEQ